MGTPRLSARSSASKTAVDQALWRSEWRPNGVRGHERQPWRKRSQRNRAIRSPALSCSEASRKADTNRQYASQKALRTARVAAWRRRILAPDWTSLRALPQDTRDTEWCAAAFGELGCRLALDLFHQLSDLLPIGVVRKVSPAPARERPVDSIVSPPYESYEGLRPTWAGPHR